METETTETAEAPTGLDIDAASDQIGADLFPETQEHAPEPTPTEQVAEALAPAPTEPVTQQPEAVNAPKSWPKDMHPHWGKVPKEVQDYWQTREKQMLDGLEQYKGAAQYGKAMQDIITPYAHLLQADGLDATQAVQRLLRAQQHLTTGTLESRQAAYEDLGKRLNLQPPAQTNGAEPSPIDPRIQSLEQQFQQIQRIQTAQQQAALEAARSKASQEVEAFAGDPKNALFDECYEDIVRFIQSGDSLQEAYDKAVWANPVTREKQVQARLQTETEKARERARLDALPKQKARGVNVKSRETSRTPTDPLGSMEDTMKKTMVAIKNKTIH